MSIWSKARATIRTGIEWAFSGYKKPTISKVYKQAEKKKASAVIKKKAESETVTKRVRARTVKGRYKGDDKSTPDVDEAWTTAKVSVRRINKTKK
jgi:hypothetical protein